MLSLNDLKLGTFITFNREPYQVTWAQHVQMGRGGAILRTKLKNLLTGNVLEKTFKGGEKVEGAEIRHGQANYLYQDAEGAHFMNNENYEQFFLDQKILGNKTNFLKEGSSVDILYYNDQPIDITLPAKIILRVTQAPPAVKGDSAQGNVTKPITLETGLVINAPLFVKEGDLVKINTETGEYVSRD